MYILKPIKHRWALIIIIFAVVTFLKSQMVFSDSVTVTEDQSIADQFIRHTVTGITTRLPEIPDVPGFKGAAYLHIGDLNNDGILEIVCTSGEGQDADPFNSPPDGEVAVFTWDGKNLDNWTQGIINNTFSFPNDFKLVDMDGDGDLDILIADNFVFGFVTKFKAGIYWLENQGGVVTNSANWVKHTIYKGGGTLIGKASLMRVELLDVDGDGKQDIITSRLDLGTWSTSSQAAPPAPPLPAEPQCTFVEVFRKETPEYVQTDADGFTGYGGTCYGYSRHVIGEGPGFLFNLKDIDGDGDLDIYATQYTVMYRSSLRVRPDYHGDSLVWFENPGASAALDPWPRYTISNNNTSCNPLGRGFEATEADIDNDGVNELLYSTNNHQDYIGAYRLWPSGIYYLDIPVDPKITAAWCPVTIETGDPLLDPTDPVAVANDVYANDRPGSPLISGSPGWFRTGDINKDGYLDLVVEGDGKGAVYYYESDGSSPGSLKFKRASLYVDPECMPSQTQIVDIDGDGDLEIVQGIYDTGVLKPGDYPIPDDYVLASSSIFIFDKPTTTAIELASFTASPAFRKVTVQWSTATEINNAGFNLYRAESENGEYVKINSELISAQGTSTQGTTYTYIDRGLKNGEAVFYKLEDIDLSGKSTFHGPASTTPRWVLWGAR